MIRKLKLLFLRYPKQFWLLVAGTLVNSLGVSLVWPFLTIYLRAKLDLPLSTITTLITMDAMMVLLSSLIAGPIIDTFGRKWVMVLGSAVNGLAYLFMAQADTYWMFAALMLARGLQVNKVAAGTLAKTTEWQYLKRLDIPDGETVTLTFTATAASSITIKYLGASL